MNYALKSNYKKNFERIYKAMVRLDPIDRSLYFDNFYKEVIQRLKELKDLNDYEKENKRLSGGGSESKG